MAQSRSDPRTTDSAFAVLSSEPRRAVLRALREATVVTARELARQLASSDRDGFGNGGYDSRRDALVALVHHHLPRLAAHGIVEYDDPLEAVTLGPRFAEIEPFLEPPAGPAAD